ncbi:MAG: hypothetical protein M1829_000438 [Trizodia sp. TS-e1964]|nr:MAG: hypothetical protein M1829_000438 [Trizodia sp. TS-e1964]
MVKKGVNVLNLPLISNFVNYAIAAAASQYVAPKSLTLDMGKILVGDDVQKEVDAIGVLWIRIHKAVGLSKQDIRGGKDGGSDPYITLSWSKFSKPMYSTRVITDDINPIWEETTALLVTTELIKADEQLSVQLWDSDRSSADDVVGKVELSMQKLIQNPGEMFPQVSELRGMDSDTSMPGKLHWEVGFYGKPHFRPALRTDGKNNDLPATLKDKPEFQDNKGSLDTESEDAVAHTPPDPLWPSGICSVIVHQIVSLSLENIKGSNGKRKGREYEPALEEGENSEEQGGEQPSSYCTIIMNDHLVYRTRSKFVTSQPIFNAGTERFMRDWRAGIVTVTVRDQRMREHDPILGVVSLKLSDILQTSSQVTRWYPLDGGIGFGRIRISLLFRSVETRLPPEMLGWDVGTFELLSERIVALGYKTHAKLKMRTGGSSGKIPKTQARATDEGDGIYWDIEKKDGKNNVRLPVRYRYRSPVVFEFHTASKRAADAYAIIWLHHLIDNEESNINIPIWKTAHGSRLTQNYVTEQNYATVTGLDDLQEVGRLQFRCRFKAGADEDHAQFVDDNDSRETQETWDACHAEGVRSRIVSSEIPEAVQDLHNKSLIDGRDVLQEADPKEKNKWLSKDGTDWTGAFGDDPAELVDGRGRKKTEPGAAINKRLPSLPSSEDDYGDSSSDGDDDVDLGIKDAHYTPDSSANGEASGANIDGTKDSGKELSGGQNKKDLHRRQRGLMQWKPARNARFALNETKFAVKRLKKKIAHSGREPDVETEV